jgi:hypothetical protein
MSIKALEVEACGLMANPSDLFMQMADIHQAQYKLVNYTID